MAVSRPTRRARRTSAIIRPSPEPRNRALPLFPRSIPQRRGSSLIATRRTKCERVRSQDSRRWRARYGGMKADDVKRLKELELENSRLKRIVADQTLEMAALREVSRGNW